MTPPDPMFPQEPENGCQAAPPLPWWQRQVQRFFAHHEPMPDLPSWAKDGVYTHVDVDWDWKDRLRILITGKSSIRAMLACEEPPGRVQPFVSAIATFSPCPPP